MSFRHPTAQNSDNKVPIDMKGNILKVNYNKIHALVKRLKPLLQLNIFTNQSRTFCWSKRGWLIQK
tara:strand:- start:386 stop:583 length:198 start_codon:yes stop_codon:yes gene_type:complete